MTISTHSWSVVAPSTVSLSPELYSQAAVDKLLAGINMLGGDICPTCGTVKEVRPSSKLRRLSAQCAL